MTRQLGLSDIDIAQAAELLKAGALVAFPTETVYGLGADARNGRAVAGIYDAKRRPTFNPLIVHVPDLESATELAEFPEPLLSLARTCWPGPLSIVAPLRRGAGLSELVTAGLETVAVRVPAHPIAQKLLRAFGGPVAAPSANRSGQISPTKAAHVLSELDGRIAAVIDGGACTVGLESTIIGLNKGALELLRPGGVPIEDIEKISGRSLSNRHPRDSINAPGQLASHYAPVARLRLNVEVPAKTEAYLAFGSDLGFPHTLCLSETGNLTEAAVNLFAHLRALDETVKQEGLNGIAVAPIPHEGLGIAINDRLARAAAPRPIS